MLAWVREEPDEDEDDSLTLPGGHSRVTSMASASEKPAVSSPLALTTDSPEKDYILSKSPSDSKAPLDNKLKDIGTPTISEIPVLRSDDIPETTTKDPEDIREAVAEDPEEISVRHSQASTS